MTVLQALKRARVLLAKGHCTGKYAIDAQGNSVYLESKEAVKFCPVGAILRVTKRKYILSDAVTKALGFETRFDAAIWNDKTNTTRVLQRIDKAIKQLKAT